MAKIRKRTLESGQIRWLVDYKDQSGRRRAKQFDKRKGAESWMARALVEVQEGRHTPESSTVTVTIAADLWLKRCQAEGLEKSTYRQYRGHVENHIKPRLGAFRLSKLTTPTVEAFKDGLIDDNSKATARKILVSLKSIIKEASRRGLVAQNIAAGVSIKITGRERTEIEIPTKQEVRALIEGAKGGWSPFLIVACFTGLRASELRGLAWEHVDLNRRMIRVEQRADAWGSIGDPKSRSGRREVPMSPMVVSALREWKVACPKGELGLVFPNGVGNVESTSNIVRRAINPLQVACGIVRSDGKARFGLHAFRHFAASWLIDQGFMPKRVQQVLGHASIGITMDTYAHLFELVEDDFAKLVDGERAVMGECNTDATDQGQVLVFKRSGIDF